MRETATAAELNEAQEIVMEESGDLVSGQDENENDSLFEETVPEFEDETGKLSSEVKPASSQPLDKETDKSKTETETDDDEEEESPEKSKKDEESLEKQEDSDSETTDDLAKVTEHKTNLEKALSAERVKNKSLQFMLDQQQDKPAQQDSQVTKPPEFKVLSDEEFDKLMEEDAVAGIRYERGLRKHENAVVAYEQSVKQANDEQSVVNQTISNSLEQIALEIPGIYEKEDIGRKLTDFAVDKGFAAEDLSVLSDPGTMIIPQGQTKAIPLGKAAVAFVKFCNDSMAGSDTTQLRADVEKEVTAKLIKKFKENPGDVGLDDIPTADNGAPEKWAPKSETELRNMSSKERDDYYSGK